jgi:hypothetical protein
MTYDELLQLLDDQPDRTTLIALFYGRPDALLYKREDYWFSIDSERIGWRLESAGIATGLQDKPNVTFKVLPPNFFDDALLP